MQYVRDLLSAGDAAGAAAGAAADAAAQPGRPATLLVIDALDDYDWKEIFAGDRLSDGRAIEVGGTMGSIDEHWEKAVGSNSTAGIIIAEADCLTRLAMRHPKNRREIARRTVGEIGCHSQERAARVLVGLGEFSGADRLGRKFGVQL